MNINFLSRKKTEEKNEDKITCKKCSNQVLLSVLYSNNMICPECGYYMRMTAVERLISMFDDGKYTELDGELKSKNQINFPDYDEKLEKACEKNKINEAVICAYGMISGIESCVFAMDSGFMMASMGSIVGEKITRLFEYATEKRLPVIGFVCSGGARMQEGIISLMQMAKVSGAVKHHSEGNNLYISILTDPTTGGVTASFAMQADIIIAEPKALIGFAGRRVIEQTTGENLPDNFQHSEFLLEHGFIDIIEERPKLKNTITNLLKIHNKQERVII